MLWFFLFFLFLTLLSIALVDRVENFLLLAGPLEAEAETNWRNIVSQFQSLDHVWANSGPCVGYIWATTGPHLGHNWAISWPRLSHIMAMSGPWAMSEPCLTVHWMKDKIILGQTWVVYFNYFRCLFFINKKAFFEFEEKKIFIMSKTPFCACFGLISWNLLWA